MTDIAIKPTTKTDQEFQAFLGHIDRTTANQAMRALSEKYGFALTEIEGKPCTGSGWIQMLFGYDNPSTLRHLCRKYGIQAPRIRELLREKYSRSQILHDLGLSPTDSESRLFDFHSLLRVARFSKTPAARLITDYVFAQEGWARREQAVQRETGRSTAQLRAYATGEAVPVRLLAVEALGLPVFELPGRGRTVCVTAIERVTGQRRGAVRDWMRYDAEIRATYDVISGRELQPLKATGWLARSACSAAVLPLQTCRHFAEKAGRLGKLLDQAIRQMVAGTTSLALPGGR